MPFLSVYEEEAEIRGKQEGKLETIQEAISIFLKIRFGETGKLLGEQLLSNSNVDLTPALLVKITMSNSLDEITTLLTPS